MTSNTSFRVSEAGMEAFVVCEQELMRRVVPFSLILNQTAILGFSRIAV